MSEYEFVLSMMRYSINILIELISSKLSIIIIIIIIIKKRLSKDGLVIN